MVLRIGRYARVRRMRSPSQPPRILFVANAVLGWSTYARQFETALAARANLAHLILNRRPQRHLMQFARRHADRPLARFLRPFDPIRMFAGPMGQDIRNAVRDFQPDVIHFAAHWPAGAIMSVASRPPYTLALDATRPSLTRDLPLPGWNSRECEREAALCKGAAHLFPMSTWAASSLQKDFGLPEDRITVQPPSLAAANWPKRASVTNNLPNILFIGNDLQRKGAFRLAKWISGPLKDRCHLHIVSTDAPAPTGPGITFHGKVPHERLLADILPQMDIFCLPTTLDMSPFVIAEAAAAGIPVVASAIGGLPDLVLQNETGFLVPPDDDAGFVAALSRLINDKAMRLRMGSRAAEFAANEFNGTVNFDHLIDRLIDIATQEATHAS